MVRKLVTILIELNNNNLLEEELICEMAKLISDYADKSLCGDIGDFIYFSPCLSPHGPRVKFYGGTKETSSTRNAPSLAFTNNGNTSLELQPWMTKKKCPNAYNPEYVSKIEKFVHKTLPILLLVWYYKLDEARALKFFEGGISFDKLLTYVTDVEEITLNRIRSCKTMEDLQRVCLEDNVYDF